MNENNQFLDNHNEEQINTNSNTKIAENCETTNCKKSKCGFVLNILLFVAVIALYVIHFTAKDKEYIPPVSIKTAITLAYVDSDTLWENYDFVKDTKKELDDLEMKLNNNYKAQGMAFKAEYDNYLKIGATLPLSEQKKRETTLQQKQQSLMELEKSLGNQILEKKQAKNAELQDSIFAFIKRYNLKTKYTLILEKSRLSGILYANDSLDITKSVVNGLNEAYHKIHK